MVLGHPERRGTGDSMWPGASVAKSIAIDLGLEVQVLRPLHWKPGQITPLYYLETSSGRYVLKLATPRPGRLPGLRNTLARQEIAHQAHVHARLAESSYSDLRVPGFVASDRRTYLLLEYLETKPHGERDLPREALLSGLLEFQTTKMELPPAPITSIGRAPAVLLARRLISDLRPRLGWQAVTRALNIARQCYWDQRRLPQPVLCHNDFHYNNLLLTKGGELYFSDFEYVSHDDRWLLADIVHFAVGTKEFRVAGDLIVDYAGRIGEALGYEFDMAAQLRFNLMLRVGQLILSASVPAAVSAQYTRLFTEVLIDDEQFQGWLGEVLWTGPTTTALKQSS